MRVPFVVRATGRVKLAVPNFSHVLGVVVAIVDHTELVHKVLGDDVAKAHLLVGRLRGQVVRHKADRRRGRYRRRDEVGHVIAIVVRVVRVVRRVRAIVLLRLLE